MKIAIIGLGKMGMQIAKKLLENGHSVIATDLSETLMQEAESYGALTYRTKEEVVAGFDESEKQVLWLMVPSEVVDSALDEWTSLLRPDSIIIDGGNSDYRLTKQRAERLKASNIHLIDSGTSGGVWGYERGFSMMVGGHADAFSSIEPVFATLSKPHGAYTHFGPAGSGHYIKMVHNAIEYGMMQSLAEGYRMLKEGPYDQLDLGEIGEVWQHGSVVQSWLNELTQDIMCENQELEGIDGVVAESGETRWTLETAKDLGIPLPAIQASFDVRLASQNGDTSYTTKLLAAMRNKFGGHTINKHE